MKNTVIQGLLRNMAICLATGGMLAACGGGDSQGPTASDTKLMADGEPCNAAWVSTTAYGGGGKVSRSGRNYTANWWTQGNDPVTSSGPAGSGQPWLPGYLCGGTTTTTKASTTTTKASTTTTKASTTTTKASTTTTKASTTTTKASTTTTKATTTTTNVSSCPAYVAGTAYASGATVTNAGGYYTCDVGGWCSSGASAYEPGVGWAWTSAWHAASASSCGGTTTTTKASTTTTGASTTTTKASTTTTGTGTTTTTTGTTTPPLGGRQVGSYFAQWGVYGRDYEVADIQTSGSASKLTFINYAFGNVYSKNGGYECDMITKLEPGATNPSAPDAGTGGDAESDYVRTPKRTVDGAAIPWDAPLSGNFLQFKKLKALNPNLKVFISLGGWSWSKFFSNAAATDALRKQMVTSCINIYIKGNLPSNGGRGGVAAAKGVFDGIDIDWEYPGGGGQPYNTFSAADKHNYTLLMQEFRRQLDAQGTADGKRYLLTAAIGAGKDKIDNTEPSLYSASMDWVNVMTYDYHGGWDTTTNFHNHLYLDPADPATGVVRTYNSDSAIQYLVAQGFPRAKLLLGVGFYGRGWTGVAAGPSGNGLYGAVSGPAPGAYEAGINDYKVLKGMAGTRTYHPVTKQLSLYTGVGGQWWSYDDATTIATKAAYVRAQSLGGMFSWELDGDLNGELAAEVWKVR